MADGVVDEHTVVFDLGSRYTKSGFAGEHFPRAFVPTVIGRFRHQGLVDGYPTIFFGNEAITNRGISNLNWPIQEGLIKNWEEVEKIWFNIFFKELHVPPEQCRILHSVSPLVPKGDREKMTEVFFETFAITGLNLVKSPVLSLYASGRTTGLVYENGACSSFVTPVFEGFPLLHSAIACELTGDAITKQLGDMLTERGYSFTTPLENTYLEKIKAKLCFVARNYTEECESFAAAGENTVHYELPDGQKIFIGAERFKCCEALFQPSLAGLTCPSVVDNVRNSIHNCDIDIRPQLYNNIVTSGGASQFPGFGTRLLFELISRRIRMPVGDKTTVLVDELPMPQNAPWIGGSMIGSMDSLKGFWMTKLEYADLGADRVNYKFF